MTIGFRYALSLALVVEGFAVTLAGESSLAEREKLPTTKARFPLKVSDNKRHLVDQDEKPFLVVGDTAWSLIADLRKEDIERYLNDRQRRGFNSIIVSLIEHQFSSDPPRNRAGTEPFKTKGDFSTPNPPYFDDAYEVIKLANDRGISVWLCPAYLGWGGNAEGFFAEIRAGGPEKLRAYGKYVGERFKDLPNIVWMVGGDYAVPKKFHWTISELATAIRSGGATQLMTVHGGQQSAVDVVGEQPWLDVNNTYSYSNELFRVFRSDYNRKPIRPFVLIESTYENEHDSKPEQIRRQAYWAITSGACGQFFGNHPIWHFDGPAGRKKTPPWQEELDGTGSRDMARLPLAVATREWHRLVPDFKESIVTKGTGEGVATITAAASPDGKLAMVYVPSTGHQKRDLTIDMSRFSGDVSASWFNPTSGQSSPAAQETLKNAGRREFRTPGDNGTKTNDWLLILEVLR